jgi:hypothetical protein
MRCHLNKDFHLQVHTTTSVPESAPTNHGLEVLPIIQSALCVSVFCMCQVTVEAQILEVVYRERLLQCILIMLFK